jgi:ABC-type multidrug transport system ATPase subunit
MLVRTPARAGPRRREMTSVIEVTGLTMDEVEELCDRVAILERGRIAALDTPDRGPQPGQRLRRADPSSRPKHGHVRETG